MNTLQIRARVLRYNAYGATQDERLSKRLLHKNSLVSISSEFLDKLYALKKAAYLQQKLCVLRPDLDFAGTIDLQYRGYAGKKRE